MVSVEVDPATGVVRKQAHDEDSAARLTQEAEALARLVDVPGVVQRLSWDAGSQTLETRLVPGPRLHEWWAGRDARERTEVAAALIEAVAAVHARGVLHRDLKPGNVVVGPDGPVLVDFDRASLDGRALAGGTPGSAAPEVGWLPDPRLIDRRADGFSLALILRRLLLGEPGTVDGEHLVGWMQSPPTGEAGTLRGVLAQLLCPDRTSRPGDLAPLAVALRSGRAPLLLPAPPPDWPPAATAALEGVLDEVGEALREPLAADLGALVPLDDAARDLPQDSWTSWARDLARAHLLRAGDDPDATWEAADLELGCGVPTHVIAGAEAEAPALRTRFAALALGLGAPAAARDALGELHPESPQVALAVYAAAEARLGRLTEASRAVAWALKHRPPTDPWARERYWWAVARALSDVGALGDLPRFVSMVEPAEAADAAAPLLAAVSGILQEIGPQRSGLARRAERLGPFVRIALGAKEREAAFTLAQLALWAGGAEALRPSAANALDTAIGALASDDPAAAILRDAAAGLRAGSATAAADAGAALDALLPEPPAPSWAEGDEPEVAPAEAPEPDGPSLSDVVLTRARRDGFDAAVADLRAVLTKGPRDARAWSLLLQLWTTSSPDREAALDRELPRLLDALQLAGMSGSELLPWRMRAHAERGRPSEALRALVEARRRHEVGWASWLMAVEIWLDLGQPERAREAADRLAASEAPDSIVAAVEQRLAQ